jgi:hypothetical protein
MSPNQRHQGRPVRAPGVGSKQRRFALLCLLALVLQVALPLVHAWYTAAGGDGAAPPTPAWASTGRVDSSPVLRPSVALESRHWHHDPALCQVCKTLTQARHYVFTPARAIDLVSSLVLGSLPGVHHHGDPHSSATSPRAPPVVS